MKVLSINRGFTLVELLVVMAIIGALASIGIPSYQDYIAKSRRQDAMDVLTGLASALDRYKTVNNTYAGAELVGESAIYPSQAPIDGATKYYDLVIDDLKATTFTILAVPISGTSQEEDGVIELLSTNQRGWDKDNSGGIDASERVWN